ncbi:MAG: S41 family peptidase [Pirellulaceae bacterium]|nr:S41 family peptidase [Pirellulaceae bacterium]
MKTAMIRLISTCFLMSCCAVLQAQEETLSRDFKESTIAELSTLMNNFYIEPDLAFQVSEHLKQQLEAGHFDGASAIAGFSESLTKEVQSISKDKHLLIRPATQSQGARPNTTEDFLARHRVRIARDREEAGGLKGVGILEGNVGYLEIIGFAQLQEGRDIADSYMKLLSGSDAIIIDLRENGGGYPEMVQYLCSYFFRDPVHLNSLYWREGDRTQEFWSLAEVGGTKMPEVPLFVLTSGKTFSAAEEFSYNMQTQKRATLVGQTTRGGANPGRIMRLNDRLEAIIPVGKAVNPITKTNWEGVGVVPDIATSHEESIVKAHELAKVAAQKYGANRRQRHEVLSAKLVAVLDSFDPETGAESVYEILKHCEQSGLLGREMVNGIGYEYLMNFKEPKIAEAIFRANTLLFPEVANVFDSYAEALAMNGKMDAAVKNYQNAVDIAKAMNDPELKYFEDHLQKAIEQIRKQ